LDSLRHGVIQQTVAGRSLAATKGAHPTARLGQVDQLEVQGEGLDDRFCPTEVEGIEIGRLALALERIIAPAQGDRPSSDALDRIVVIEPGLLDDDLTEQGPEQTDLAGQRIARTGRSDPGRLCALRSIRPDRRAHAGASAHTRRSHDRNPAGTRPQPSAVATFPTLVW
jgi:hypothetical protein